MKLDFKKFVVSGILGGIAYFVLWLIVSFGVRPLLWPYNPLSLGGMRSINDPLMLLFFLYPFVAAFCMAAVYQKIEPVFKGSWMQKGKKFGLLVWVVATIPSFFVVLTSMNYPIGFFIENVVGGLVYTIAAGMAIAKFSG